MNTVVKAAMSSLVTLAFTSIMASHAGATPLAQLVPSEADSGSAFGGALAISQGKVVVGAPFQAETGVVYVFDAASRSQLYRLQPAGVDPGDGFGSAVAIGGHHILVGAPFDDLYGAAYLFDADTGQFVNRFTTNAPAPWGFGSSVALDNNLAFIGAPGDESLGENYGSIYVFDVISGDSVRVISPGESTCKGFGRSLAFSGGRGITGATGAIPLDCTYSAVFLLSSNSTLPTAKLTDSREWFGRSVAMGATHAVVGAEGTDPQAPPASPGGAAFLIDLELASIVWARSAGTDGFENGFGYSSAIGGDIVLAGAPFSTAPPYDVGFAYLLDSANGTQAAVFSSPSGNHRDLFGYAVATDGTTGVIGSPMRIPWPPTQAGLDMGPGSAYVFDVQQAVPVRLSSFSVERRGAVAVIKWVVVEVANHAGFHVYRQTSGTQKSRLTASPLSGQSAYEFTDQYPPFAGAAYWLAELRRDGNVAWHGPIHLEPASPPSRASLGPAVPNPLRLGKARARINFEIPDPSLVCLEIFDLAGRRIRLLEQEQLPAGAHGSSWDGTSDLGRPVPAGIYFCRLQAGAFEAAIRLVVTP